MKDDKIFCHESCENLKFVSTGTMTFKGRCVINEKYFSLFFDLANCKTILTLNDGTIVETELIVCHSSCQNKDKLRSIAEILRIANERNDKS